VTKLAIAALTVACAAWAQPAATLVVRGLSSTAGLAVDPQGAPFVAAGAQIARVLARNTWKGFAESGGRLAGLAFDAAGELYAVDRQRKSILKITPWGRITVFAQSSDFAALDQLAVGPGGELYCTDPGASRVYRISASGRVGLFTSEVSGPRGLAVTADGRLVFIADRARTIWRFTAGGAGRTRVATLADEGDVAALALDGAGNLYAACDGGGALSVLSPDGKLMDRYALPGPGVTGLAFGGLDLRTLYVAESSTGAVYKLRAAQRSQRLPWEPDQPLRILDPPDGAILNRHDGQPTAGGLRVWVEGAGPAGAAVRINGAQAEVRDGRFRAPVVLRERETRILAEAPGGLRDAIVVLWDRDSVPRYRFSVDDNIRFLKDLAEHAANYRSIFDNPYLGFWRTMHDKYGAKIHFNIYYQTQGFNLSQMPVKYREEWQQNAGWIRLTFHARANEPDRPYLEASAEEIREDYRLVTREIERFAGKELLSPFTTVHWGTTTLAGARALRAEGVRGLAGYFEARDELPTVCYYLPLERWRYLMGRDYWKDTREDLLFIRHDIVVNTVPLEKIVPHLERVAADPHQSEVLELMIHEQYFYPDYVAYEPDFRQRVERALQWVTQRGYKPVFYKDGFLGAGRAE
jgi:sugar lactone lactonase YvrE